MPKLTVIYWRDIPAQLIGQQGRSRYKLQLSDRFAVAIDRAAMRAGRGTSKAYLDDWRRESRSCDGNIEQIVSDEAARLEAAWPDELLERVVKSGGLVAKSSLTNPT